MTTPQRGEIWLVNLDPTIGAEIKKTRPAVVVSSDSIGKLPLRIIVPITEWQPHFTQSPWLVRLDAEPANGLSKTSAADSFQVRCVSVRRLARRLGSIPVLKLKEITAAVAVCMEHE